MVTDLSAKRVELLLELRPLAARLGVPCRASKARQHGNLLASFLSSFTHVFLAIEAPASPTKAKTRP
jgi:hypothetical protein